MKNAHVGNHIRQLCSLGLHPALVIPEVIKAIKAFVGAEWGMFSYANDSYDLVDVYSQNGEVYSVLPRYFEEIVSGPGQGITNRDFSIAMRLGVGYRNSACFEPKLLDSRMYDEFWRVLDIRHCLELTATDGRRGWGSMQFMRPHGARSFSDSDYGKIACFASHIAHALRHPRVTSPASSDDAETASVIIDEQGRMKLETPGARAILCLAFDARAMDERHVHAQIPLRLAPLLGTLRNLRAGRPCPPARLEMVGEGGRFVFRAYPLQEAGAPSSLVALHIDHFAPLSLRVETLGIKLGLSARQRQLCAHLLAGESYASVGDKLGITLHTAIDHARKIHEKLGTTSREEIKAKFSGALH